MGFQHVMKVFFPYNEVGTYKKLDTNGTPIGISGMIQRTCFMVAMELSAASS